MPAILAYLDGFSPDIKEILAKFKFKNQIDTLIEADILIAVISKTASQLTKKKSLAIAVFLTYLIY